ncbi:selenocysteine lyase-like [Saccoglossus kowalevskii]|uniref:Selenocysteine lyase n=1 Tax=Saccoglossus kowalevskii TaxID=10224 RepID=A0ABM0GU32_SACKO|nr:PREDICTED: selenocysteine lyase-like [Saccoglossus kowalevskii]
MEKKSIYLDYNATTPLEPDVLSSIQLALQDAWGNPSSAHSAGQKAKSIIVKSRAFIAEMINARSDDIIITSGGTEANNLVFHTAMRYYAEMSSSVNHSLPHVVTSNLEHDSIKLVVEHFVKENKMEATFVTASKLTGRVEVNDIISAIKPNTCLVTVMMANNETGVIQPIAEISKAVKSIKRNPRSEVFRILIHTDAAQAIGKIPVDVEELGVDYLTIVGHKFYGPRIGALYAKEPGCTTPIYPMLFGGGQERNFRPGTENTGMIAGLGKVEFGERVHFNGRYAESERLPNTCNVSIQGPGLEGYKILQQTKHLQASVGAACHSEKHSSPSHILLSIGVPYDVASNAIRLSIGRDTTTDDIDLVVSEIKQAVQNLEK